MLGSRADTALVSREQQLTSAVSFGTIQAHTRRFGLCRGGKLELIMDGSQALDAGKQTVYFRFV